MSNASLPSGGFRGWIGDATRAWDRFWFTPRTPHTLAMIRILCGAMLVYVHVIWLSLVDDFFGPHAWIDRATWRYLHELDYSRTYLSSISNPWIVGAHEVIAIVVCAAMAVGFMTRFAVPIAWFMTLMVCHRQTGALFGLDQMVMMLSMYLIFSPCGAVYSLDAWRARRRAGAAYQPAESVAANAVTRLIQVHLCIVYLFGGISKLRGDLWWEGTAMWWSIVNYEYQSLDVTWLGRWPLLIAVLTHATLFWETCYAALIWPRLTRPLVLAMAVFVHGGIALALGMPTFGVIMIVANLAFIAPETMAAWVEWARRKIGLQPNTVRDSVLQASA